MEKFYCVFSNCNILLHCSSLDRLNLVAHFFQLFLLGISRSAKGYSMISVLETMKTFSVEDCLTEEAVVTKLRTCQYHYLFLHSTLRQNSSGLTDLVFRTVHFVKV